MKYVHWYVQRELAAFKLNNIDIYAGIMLYIPFVNFRMWFGG